jgi:hypothetical protein
MQHVWETRNAHRILVENRERKRLLRRPRLRWGDNININLKEIGPEIVHWIHLTQDKE